MDYLDLDTPAVLIDLDVLERNIAAMAERCRTLGIALRPHIKTHKIPQIARMQLAAGARGITCQKLGEAEVMAAAGIRDILITYNIVGRLKLKRLTELARLADVMVTVDSLAVAEGISRQAVADEVEVRVLVETDTGGHRTGVGSAQAAMALGRQVHGLPGLRLQGLMTYPSHPRCKPLFEEARALFGSEGLPCPIISGGGTGEEADSVAIGCTEHRSGSYIYEGLERVHSDADLDPARCPVSLLVTVVSVPTVDRIIVDGGQKTFRARPTNPYGLIVEHPDALIRSMSVEHGHVDVSGCAHTFHVGERVRVIPRHAGMTTNLHDEAVAVRGGEVIAIWPIAGRGKVK